MKDRPKLRVVIADDESLVASLINRELVSLGMEVVGRASDGRRAVELVRTLRPTVVLLDLAMPEMDGFAAAAEIQATCPTPVVILSAHDSLEDVSRASAAGAGAYLVKPPQGPELERAIQIAVARHADLLETRRLNLDLRQALRDKEALLKEVNHRVKNNLQLIASLLRLQARTAPTDAARAVLDETHARISLVSRLHELLYRTADYAEVALDDYLRQIAESLLRSHGEDARTIRLVCDLAPVKIATKQAIPCGLIVNELLTNSLKHAFTGRDHGEIRVALEFTAERQVRLTVSDDGSGLPDGFDPLRAESLGLQLVFDLSRQLGAEFSLERSARFSATFLPAGS